MPSLYDIKSRTENLASFVEWLAEVLRSKKWVTILLLLDVGLAAVFNPAAFSEISKLLAPELKLPTWYTPAFWLVISLVFIAAVIVAIRAPTRKAEAPVAHFAERSAIKGLRPFGRKDAELFARLQREQDLRGCLEAITERDFRFGILCGESGSGKTSFVQAGLWPRFAEQKTPHRAIYVKFTDWDPLDSIRQALMEQTLLSREKAEGADFSILLEDLVKTDPQKPVVLLFDQFEQFFVHRERKEEREAFVQALAAWYRQRPPLPIKILVSIRGDFLDRLIEFQKAMDYSLGLHNFFRLEKFTPEQTTEIFRVIAQTEHLEIDKGFVQGIAEQELASHEDGRVSPVDIQILAWMIGGQKTTEERAFHRTAYQKLGGVEGLLERFLTRVLQVRETETRRQNAIKVMIALTDLERNARVGVLSLDDLQLKLAGTMAEDEIAEAVTWLARGDVRLVTPIQRNDTIGYELAHERLIPPCGAWRVNFWSLLTRLLSFWIAG